MNEGKTFRHLLDEWKLCMPRFNGRIGEMQNTFFINDGTGVFSNSMTLKQERATTIATQLDAACIIAEVGHFIEIRKKVALIWNDGAVVAKIKSEDLHAMLEWLLIKEKV